MDRILLIVMAACNPDPSAFDCRPSVEQASMYEYPRLVDCVRDLQIVREDFEAYCTGEAFDPRKAELG